VASSRVGTSVRSARERAGWTREALAYHSGLSGAAIAQIESGRRQEVRLGSLVALADALEVSVDYLVGSRATLSPKLLRHGALIYDSDDEYVHRIRPFLVEGIRRSEGVLVVAAGRQIDLLRDALGDDAVHVEFQDSAQWLRTTIGAMNGFRAFVKERFERGAPWTRIIGEPVWAGRSEDEVVEWTRFESMLNLSFSSLPASIICPYATSVPDSVLAHARQTHPEVAEAGDGHASLAYTEPEDFLVTSP
jgi:transcriptional regulator with XRE-family HTH domain